MTRCQMKKNRRSKASRMPWSSRLRVKHRFLIIKKRRDPTRWCRLRHQQRSLRNRWTSRRWGSQRFRIILGSSPMSARTSITRTVSHTTSIKQGSSSRRLRTRMLSLCIGTRIKLTRNQARHQSSFPSARFRMKCTSTSLVTWTRAGSRRIQDSYKATSQMWKRLRQSRSQKK